LVAFGQFLKHALPRNFHSRFCRRFTRDDRRLIFGLIGIVFVFDVMLSLVVAPCFRERLGIWYCTVNEEEHSKKKLHIDKQRYLSQIMKNSQKREERHFI
jgi:hypothetical protein